MLSPTLFLNGVLGLIRIGKQARNAYAESVLRRETLIHFIPQFGEAVFSARDSREWAAAFIRERRTSHYFDQLYKIEHGAPTPRFAMTAPEWDAAFDAVSRELGLFAPKDIPEEGFPAAIRSPAVVLTHHEWFKDTRSPWGRFGLAVADVALDFLSQEPELLGPNGLGLGKDTRRVANAILPNLANALRPDLYQPGGKSVGETLGEALFQAALETVVEDPTLVTSKEHWQPIVEAAVGSVQTQVQETIGAGESLFARDRVSAFVQGPFVHAVIGAVDNNVDAFLKGSFKDEKLLGQVSRNLLGHLSELTPEDADLKAFFSPRGAAMIFDSALETLAERPELVIRGTGEDVDLSRRFLTSVAGLVKGAPPPFNSNDLATDIGVTVLEIGRDYALTQIMAEPGDADWDVVM